MGREHGPQLTQREDRPHGHGMGAMRPARGSAAAACCVQLRIQNEIHPDFHFLYIFWIMLGCFFWDVFLSWSKDVHIIYT